MKTIRFGHARGGGRGGVSAAVLFAMAFAGAAVPGWADTPIAICGYVISVPGNYGVTTNLNCPGTAITINASNVSLKLNGFIITGPSTAVATAAYGIDINPGGPVRLNHVAIAGPGLIQNFYDGILINNVDYSQVSQITAAHNFNGIQTTPTGMVNYLTIGSNNLVANQNDGIDLAPATNSTVTYNDLSGNSFWGLCMWNGSQNTVNNNVASGNGADGFYFSNNYSRVFSNVTNGNTGSGIAIYPAVMIPLTAAVGNEIFNNTSSVGNGESDLDDQNPQGSNFWSNNVFFTASQPWIH